MGFASYLYFADDKAQRRLLRSTAKRRPAGSGRNEDEAQATNLVIARAQAKAIKLWWERCRKT
jgi:hypothetical protein